MFKLAHFSDLHLSEKTKDEAIPILKFIFDKCRECKVNAILNTGDTFDGPVVLGDRGPVNEFIEQLQIVPQPFYAIEGTKSHDLPGSIDFIQHIDRLVGNIFYYIFKEPQSFQVVKFPDEVIFGDLFAGDIHPNWNLDPGQGGSCPCGHLSVLPAPTKSFLAKDLNGSPEEINQAVQQRLRDILAGFGVSASGSPKPHILMAHITVSGSEASTGQVLLGGEIQVSVADLELAKADYIALGHIHKAQQSSLPPHIHYAGSPYHQNFGELEPKGFKIVTFDDDGKLADVRFVETPSRPRQTIDVHLIDGKLEWSEGLYLKSDVRVRIYAPQHQLSDDLINEVKEFCKDAHSLKIETIPQAENRIRAAELSGAKSLREKLISYGETKAIDIPESALQKADELEEAAL